MRHVFCVMILRMFLKQKPGSLSVLDDPLGQHSVGYLQEAGDVGTGYQVAGHFVFICCPDGAAVNVLHNLPQPFIHLFKGWDSRIPFWLISRPDTATPPALAALAGANRIPCSRK